MKWNFDDNDEIKESYEKAEGPEIRHQNSKDTGARNEWVIIAVLAVIAIVLAAIWWYL
jgi:hypothetical protein